MNVEQPPGADEHIYPFATPRAAALAVLTSDAKVSRRAGSFLGQCVVDPTPLTKPQLDWLQLILRRAGLPPLERRR